MRWRALITAMLLATLAACGGADTGTPADPPAGAIKSGIWRVVLDHPGGGLPFSLEIAQTREGQAAIFINGKERMPAEEVSIDGPRLEIRMPSYDASLIAQLQADGTLAGTVTLNRRLYKMTQLDFPLTATFGQTWRHFPQPDPNPARIAPKYSLKLSAPDGAFEREGVGLFTQNGAYVTGTILFSTGDYRFLAGEVKDGELYLSTFDGGQGTVWRAVVAPDGHLEGTGHLASYGLPPLPFTAVPDDDAALPDAYGFTKLNPGVERFSVAFPDVDGNMVSLDDPHYQGKVIVVTIGGTWCPTCHDEAAFLSPLHKARQEDGLEVVGLQFEYTDDLERSRQQIRRFAARYDISYPLLVAGTMGQEGIVRALPMISGFTAYPTTLIIDRDGKVRKIHTSFPSAATGLLHQSHTAEFSLLIDQLLAE